MSEKVNLTHFPEKFQLRICITSLLNIDGGHISIQEL